MSQKALSYLAEYKRNVEPFIDSFISLKRLEINKLGSLPVEVFDRYSESLREGKMVRGALIQLGYEMSGKKVTSDVLDLSLFIEIFHTGLLVQDDVMDEDITRRGRDALHYFFQKRYPDNASNYGASLATVMGDLSFFYAYEHIAQSAFPDVKKIKMIKIFSQFAERTGYGQILDIENSADQTQENLLSIYRYKTAEYTFALPLIIGSVMSNKKIEEKNVLEFGNSLGIAYQIQDDLLEIFGDNIDVKKDMLSDIFNEKPTVLMSHFKDKAHKKSLDSMTRIIQSKEASTENTEKVKNLFTETGTYTFAESLIKKHIAHARDAVKRLETTKESKDLLLSFVQLIAERKG